jgi:hypothetical protein
MVQALVQGLTRSIGAALVAVLLCACGGGGGAAAHNKPNPAPTTAGYGITARVVVQGHPEQSGWVRVPPVDWQSWSNQADVKTTLSHPPLSQPAPGPKSQSVSGPPRHVEATVQGSDGGVTDTVAQDANLNFAPGWSLLYWATTACYQPTAAPDPSSEASSLLPSLFVDTAPWRILRTDPTTLRDYYIFGDGAGNPDGLSCDAQLLMQETLLCAADHLAQLGDSPGTVTWSGSDGASNPATITVTIPPQRSDDIFIARDMALNALAHLLRLDTESRVFDQQTHTQAGVVPFQSTCIAEYGKAPLDSDVSNVFSVSGSSTYFDPVPLSSSSSATDFQAAGKLRLTRKANLLTSAARLVKDLLERSVQDDISGAQQRLSSSTDALSGAELAWGADPKGDPYNTLHHALRTLFGRLEIGNYADPRVSVSPMDSAFNGSSLDWIPHQVTRDDPECGPFSAPPYGFGVTALNEFFSLPSVSARWDDAPPKTPTQSLALSILDQAGIVAPPSIVQLAGPAAVRAAVLNVLVGDAAQRAGYTSPTDFLATDAGTATSTLYQSISDEDLAFALERVYDAFRLLTESDAETSSDPATVQGNLQTAALNAGLTLRDTGMTVGAIVVQGGLPRDELSVDPMASLSKLQHLSSCGTFANWNVGPNPAATTDIEAALGPNGGDVTVFQNPFLLAEGFRRQLATVASAAVDASATDVSTFANLSAAEVRQWAGPGTLLTEDPGGETSQNLYLVNISPQDLGAATKEELGDRLILVSSSFTDSSIAANCLAGLRQHCPTALVPPVPGTQTASALYRQTSSPPQYVDLSAPLAVGLDNQTIQLSYPYPIPAAGQSAGTVEAGSYVVLLPQNGKPGQVLGWLRTPDAQNEIFAESYSHEQRDLAAKVFGIGRTTEPARSCTNVAPLSLPTEYCIAGMQRDQFVPLANELNSTDTTASPTTDDSWKNYLDLADAAATKADTLGEQMIQQGLDQDLRKESAEEDLGTLCGGYTTVDNVGASGGNITIPSDDSQLKQCVNGDAVDLVFFRDDPFAQKDANQKDMQDPATGFSVDLNSSTTQTDIRNAFCKNPSITSPPPFCSRNTTITHVGLNFVTGVIAPPTGDIVSACQVVSNALPPASSGDPVLEPTNFGNMINSPWALQGALGAAIHSLHLVETPDGEWSLQLSKRVIAGSDIAVEGLVTADNRKDVWPYCSRAGCSPLGQLIGNIFPAIIGGTDSIYPATYPTLRSQVEKTVFYMGALAGEIPAGAIQMPIPVANRNGTALAHAVIPAPALYGPSDFIPTDSTNTAYEIEPTGLHYLGLQGWGASDNTSMGIAKPFPNSAYLSSRETGLDWRDELYAQAVSTSQYLYVQTTSPNIGFDDSLIASEDSTHGGRDSLLGWLQGVQQKYTSGDPTFIDTVQQASYLTSPGVDTRSSTAQVYCAGKNTFLRGRDVCPSAPVSPVFHTFPNPDPTIDTCNDPRYTDVMLNSSKHLLVTDVPSDGYMAGAVADADYGTALAEIQADAFMSATLAAGGEQRNLDTADLDNASGPAFIWATTSDECPTNQWDVNTACDPFQWHKPYEFGLAAHSIWHDRLKPSMCPPDQRLELFLDTELNDRATAMEALVAALGLSCVYSNDALQVSFSPPPPPIKSLDDIRYFEGWLQQFAFAVDSISNVLYLVDVPTDVVKIAQNKQSDVGAVSDGTRGTLELDLEQKLASVESGFHNVASNLQNLSAELDKTRLQLQLLDDEDQKNQLTIAAASIDNDRQRNLAYASEVFGIAKAAASIATGVVPGNQASAALGAIQGEEEAADGQIDADAANALATNLQQQAAVATDTSKVQQSQAVTDFSCATVTLYQSIDDGLTGLRNSSSAALQDIGNLDSNATKALIDLAKAGGADFMEVNGKQVPLTVNTVYRRQFDLTKQRYQLALDSAKRAAYLARLSIEQRLGVRLDDLHENIGPLEAPATWVDDLCTVQGVDYTKLQQAPTTTDTSAGTTTDPNAESALINGLANQFIGDYVDKLRQFVQFYNVQFPFSESNDVAIVSLREDLPSSLSECTATSKNLLFYSDELASVSSDVTSADMVSHGGWRTTGCDAASCLTLSEAGALLNADGTILAAPGGIGRASLLATRASDPTTDQVIAQAAPTNGVFQTVSLLSGNRYELSWWDMSRSSDGTPISAGASLTPYNASVFDSGWNLVAGNSFAPAKSTDGVTWSDRHSIEIDPASDGEYHVLFTAGAPQVVGAGLAIADVQLETGAGNQGTTTFYQANQGTLTTLTGKCQVDTPDRFRARFNRRCDTLGCYFELKDLLTIDTQALNEGASSLVGKLAPGNYNYRNNTIAVNVVGTGVIDCSQSNDTSCNGSAYVQYDLQHGAYDIPIDDYEGGVRCFDFGSGAINSGKALASERFITLPMSSADRDLIGVSPFLKPDFMGRPLSGSYRLRIRDEPQLVWQNVNDIQIVMNYSYWSRVARSPGN